MPSIEKIRMVNSGTEATMSYKGWLEDTQVVTKLLNLLAVIMVM